MNAARIALAVASGLSVVCSTCTKYWRARDAGIPGDRCLSETDCGSPLAGKAFHDYEGPICNFEAWCFVCGQPSTHAARHDRSGKMFGLCKEHVAYLRDLGRKTADGLRGYGPSNPGVVATGGKLLSVDALLGRRKKTLLETIMETETELEAKRRV